MSQADVVQASPDQSKRLVAAVLAVEAVAFTGGITVAPSVIDSMVADNDSTGAILGAFIAIGAFLAFLLSPALGLLSDRYGRRPILILSLVCGALANAMMAFAPNLLIFFLGRIISGLAGATLATCYAYASDITAEDDRTGTFGFLGAIFGLGLIAGPALGGIIGAWSDRAPFWAAAILCAVSAAIVAARLPESLPSNLRAQFSWGRANPAGSLGLLGRQPRLWRGGLVHFLLQSVTNLVLVLFVLYTMDRYGWTILISGLALAATGVLRAIVQLALVERLSARYGDAKTVFLGLICGVVGFTIWSFAPTGIWFLTGSPFVALLSVASPSLMSIMTRGAAASEQGQLQGALNSISAVAGIAAPFLFGALYAFVAVRHLPVLAEGATLFLGGMVLVAAAGIALFLDPRFVAAEKEAQ